IVGDMTALWVYRREPDLRTLVRFLPSAMVGVVIGVFYFAHADGPGVRRTIGVSLLRLVLVAVARRQRAPRRSVPVGRAGRAGAPAAVGSQPGLAATAQGVGYGLMGGFTTMVANAAGPVMSLYFYAMRMPVLTFLGTSAWYF